MDTKDITREIGELSAYAEEQEGIAEKCRESIGDPARTRALREAKWARDEVARLRKKNP